MQQSPGQLHDWAMISASSLLPAEIETVAELRELYRAAESRAARLRLLSAGGHALALAEPATIWAVVQDCAERLAYFLGHARAEVSFAGKGLPIPRPGQDGVVLGRIAIGSLAGLEDIADTEDREAARLLIELMGIALDRVNREDERTRILAALREREQRLEWLVGTIFSAQEDERRRVSQELHDGVAQTATALLRLLEGSSATGLADLPGAERARLAGIARDLVRELRAIIGGLRPTLLDDLGLEAALRALGETLEQDGFAVTVTLPDTALDWPAHVESALFRVAQEAVANIRKHAGGACRVEVALAAGNGVTRQLTVRDFGRGPNGSATGEGSEAEGNHVGIDVMRERMAAIGGQLDWRGGTDGVTVIATLPVGA
jgi:two-component system NarL family sensor kinase